MNEVVIAYITDDNYVMPTIVSINSAIMNKNESSIYKIFIIGVSINEENKKIIDEFISKNINDKTYIEILHFNQAYGFVKNNHPYVTSAIIYKFDIANILSDFDKVLYLDCDTIVLKDLAELFNIDINDYYAAVVKDYYIMEILKYNEKIGIKDYFNAGVKLLNTKLLRIEKMKEKLLEHLINNENQLFFEQCTFNHLFIGKIKFIHPKYNYIIDTMQQVDTKILSEFYEADINEPIVIMHLAGPKPFSKDMPYINYFYNFYYYYQHTDYFKNNPLWLIDRISEQKVKSLDNHINNEIRNIHSKIEDLNNKIINELNDLRNKVNNLEIENNKIYSENWI